MGLPSGVFNALGAWALFVAMKSGGKASIICPLTASCPLVVVLLVAFVLHESLTVLQGPRVLSALTAVVLLST